MSEFTVYLLIDPRDGLPFYVGCTRKPEQRKRTHMSGCSSSCAYDRVKDIRACDLKPIFEVVKDGMGKIEALWLEREMIYEVPTVLNRKTGSGKLSEILFPREMGSPEHAINRFKEFHGENDFVNRMLADSW